MKLIVEEIGMGMIYAAVAGGFFTYLSALLSYLTSY